ncbi:DUF4282 domain-containing protein [Candidatus Saccharibacteria bacterium]|nr:DUF4282 domain-containing protein [Candidatus Saccharibacteria bacterium]
MSGYEAYQLINSGYGSNTSTVEGIGIWGVIALILAIIGGILVYFLFVKNKTTPKGSFAKWLKNFLEFKIMWIEPILKVAYYIATIFIVLYSFSFFGMVSYMGGTAILMFFICLIFGPIVIRLAYELTMMFIMIWRNTQNISDNTAKKSDKK